MDFYEVENPALIGHLKNEFLSIFFLLFLQNCKIGFKKNYINKNRLKIFYD